MMSSREHPRLSSPALTLLLPSGPAAPTHESPCCTPVSSFPHRPGSRGARVGAEWRKRETGEGERRARGARGACAESSVEDKNNDTTTRGGQRATKKKDKQTRRGQLVHPAQLHEVAIAAQWRCGAFSRRRCLFWGGGGECPRVHARLCDAPTAMAARRCVPHRIPLLPHTGHVRMEVPRTAEVPSLPHVLAGRQGVEPLPSYVVHRFRPCPRDGQGARCRRPASSRCVPRCWRESWCAAGVLLPDVFPLRPSSPHPVATTHRLYRFDALQRVHAHSR